MLEIDYDPKDINSFLTDLDKAVVFAATHAVNRAAVTTRSESIKDVISRRKIRARTLRKGMEIDKAKSSRKLRNIVAKVKGEGSGLPIDSYSYRKAVVWGSKGKRVGVTIEVKSGQRKLVKDAFVRRVSNFAGKGREDVGRNRIFKRKRGSLATDSYPIRLVFSSEVSSVFSNTIPYISNVPGERFAEIFTRDIDFRLRSTNIFYR